MSDKIFEKVAFNDSFEINDEFTKTVMGYAVAKAVDDIGSYWGGSEAEQIISDSTFALNAAKGVCGDSSRVKSLTKEYCEAFVKDIYQLIEENEEEEDNKLRIDLAQIVDNNFDYLRQLCKFALGTEKTNLYDMWRQAGLSNSSDSNFYDYLWSKVKRQKGSVEVKLEILKHGFGNRAISDSLLKKIAKSSPKNIKRTATDQLSRVIINKKYQVTRHTNSGDHKLAAFIQKQVDDEESKIMLFVDCTDRAVVSNLLDCLSKDNLPWLMPSASQHNYLSNRLQRMLDSE